MLCAMNLMKIGKARGPSWIVLEMFKVGGDKCLKSLTNIFSDILFKEKLLEEWMLLSLVPIFQEKGDPFSSKSYRGIKLLEHAFQLYEKILDGHLSEVVDIDKIQYGFMSERGTVDAVGTLYSEEKLSGPTVQSQKEKDFLVFVHLEKHFDWVPRKVICFPVR